MAVFNRADLQTEDLTLLPSGTGALSSANHRQSNINMADSSFNLVNNYETGTFSATVIDSGGGATYAIGDNNCRYARLLNVVYFTIDIFNITTVGAPTGNLRVGNIPAFSGILNRNSVSVSYWIGNTSTFYFVTGRINTAGYIDIYRQASLDSNMAALPADNFLAGAMTLSGFYFVTP